MVMLETQRLIMRQINESDWTFFSDLYRDEQAMALIAAYLNGVKNCPNGCA